MRARTLAIVAAVAALLTACGTPGATLLPTIEPRGEVLAYFAPEAPALVLIETDPEAEGMQALAAGLAASGALDPLRDAGRRHGLLFAQLRPLLGGEMAVGIPRPGAGPLAVMVAGDASVLASLADSRVAGGRASRAGDYRGARLYAAYDHAFALRGRVLLVSRGTADLRDALDQRAADETFKSESLPDGRDDPLARAFLDAAARVGERGRSVPWLAAIESLTAVLRADEGGATLEFTVPTEGVDLLEVDVPVSPGKRAPLAVTAGAPSVTVRDLAHVAGVAERAARAAFPLTVLRLDQARRTLRHAGKVDLDADILSRLHGPATVVRNGERFSLRADPSRPRPLRRALRRTARVLDQAFARARLDGFSARSSGGFHEILRDGRVVARIGMVGDVLVAGTGSERRLRALARAPLARPAGAGGGLTVTVPEDDAAAFTGERLGFPLRWRLDGWARGGRDELRGALRFAW